MGKKKEINPFISFVERQIDDSFVEKRIDDSHLQPIYDTIDFSGGEYPDDCCLCGRNLASHSRHPNGNNPDPLRMEGRSCDECDSLKIRPLREARMRMEMSPVKSKKSVVGWGPDGLRYFREDGYSFRMEDGISQLLLNGKVVKERNIDEW